MTDSLCRESSDMLLGGSWPAGAAEWLSRQDRQPVLVVDSHTAGNPTRIVVGGSALGDLASGDVPSVRARLRGEADWLRTRLVHEPRGGGLTCAVLPVHESGENWDIGAVILEPGSYPPMCGHCMLGFTVVAAELGLVDAPWLDNRIAFGIRTPAGVIRASAIREGDTVTSASIVNVDSYVVTSWSHQINGRTVHIDLVWGGDYYLCINAQDLGLTLTRPEADEIVRIAREITRSIAERPISDPATGTVLDVYQVLFHHDPGTPDGRRRITVVAPPGVIDRSPCGTGSSALIALLVQQGTLVEGSVLTTESIIGSRFSVRALSVTESDGTRRTVPEITSSAHINGFLVIAADGRDELRDGFPPL